MAVHWLIDSAGLFNAVSCYERASRLNRAVEWKGVVWGGGALVWGRVNTG
jgi:hypothetical protein